MARALSTAALLAIVSHSTAEQFLTLLTLAHSTFTATKRYVNDTAAVTSNGNTFAAFPFSAVLTDPVQGEGEIVVDGIDQSMQIAIRGASYPRPTFLLQVVLRNAPDTVLGSISGDVLAASYDTKKVTLQVGLEPLLSEAFPSEVYTPARFPELA